MRTATTQTETIAPVTSPFVVVVDSREQEPFEFYGLRADADQDGAPLIVRTVTAGLSFGDYAIEGMEGVSAIERKSFPDLHGTLSRGRKRWERELKGLDAMQFAAVVVETSWTDLMFYQPQHGGMSPKSLMRSIIAYSVRYRVAWFAPGNRELAAAMTYRLLERVWKDSKSGRLAEVRG